MPIEIKVTPPGITISQGRTFMVTDQRGEIAANADEGVYAFDTRFISFYRIYIDHHPWKFLNSSQLSFYAARFHLTNPRFSTVYGDFDAHTIGLTIHRAVGMGIHEDFDIVNYNKKKIRFVFEIVLRADFADLFEVKEQHILLRGRMQTNWDGQKMCLRTSYTYQDFHRALAYQILNTTAPVNYANGAIFFDIELEPDQKWHTCGEIIFEHGQQVENPLYMPCGLRRAYTSAEAGLSFVEGEPPRNFDERQEHWHARSTRMNTPNEHVYRMYWQAIEDMGALRIYDLDISDEAWVPAAGVPWFVTLFGRDSLIVSLQNMFVYPEFARGALQRLAEYQATEWDDWRDAQPGKILHEVRCGELAYFHQIPFTPYYGTADATSLYLLVLSEMYRWTSDIRLLQEYRKVAEACLHWIDSTGDLDGDGFQEYKTFSRAGYENMGWKDSGDAVVYANGSQVKQPKALCELQGYVYDAKMRMAEVFQVLGEDAQAKRLLQDAKELKCQFNQAFWMEKEGCFAFGLDAEKRQITSIASNAGHCLWSGIAEQEKAECTAKRLLEEDMWSGWGIRTLSRSHPAFNPYSYHLGSVWPHDNGIIAAGFKRYGLVNEANQVIRGIFDAARRFEAYRLPEVFAGLTRERKEVDFPALYPGGANIPQAWASGCIFHMLQTILGLRADAPHKRLYVNPTLPDWLPEIKLQHLHIGPSLMTLYFWREGKRTRWEVLDSTTNEADAIQVTDEPESALAFDQDKNTFMKE